MKAYKKQLSVAALAVVSLLGFLLTKEERPAAGGAEDLALAERGQTAPEPEVAVPSPAPADRADESPEPQAAPAPATPDEMIAALLSQRLELSDPAKRAEVVAELKRLEALKHAALSQRAALAGHPLVSERGAVLTGYADDTPLYDIPHNDETAIATGAKALQDTPYNLTGNGLTIGQWEVGAIPLLSHLEFGNRVTVMDGTVSIGFHASHVAGTMIGAGIDPTARGMAPGASLLAFSSTNMESELAAIAASAPGQPGTIQVSNHAYGAASGWEFSGSEWYGTFSDDGNPSTNYPQFFGQYTSTSAAWDGLAWNAPYHLMVKSSGNHRDDAPAPTGVLWFLNGSLPFFYDPSSHPAADGQQESTGTGFGTIDPRATAKNVLTVGSVTDVVANGNRVPGSGVASVFSSFGPTDDGRIKPDLVTDGEAVKSAGELFPAYYEVASGTSMAAAGASGSALLLTELYGNLFPGEAMLASSLKALLIHTADDMGRPGPDYEYGWGLMNVQAAADLLNAHAAAGANRGHLVEEQISNAEDEDNYTFYYDGVEPLRITLCWTDPAGNWTTGHDNRSKRLVHDLDLKIEKPNGNLMRPYRMPYTQSWAAGDLVADATKGRNKKDNVEQVYRPSLSAGTYTIIVEAFNDLAQGSQDYSLVISGADMLVDPDPVVVNRVDDMLFSEEEAAALTGLVDCNQIFTGTGLQFSAAISGEGIVTHTLNPDGTLDLFRLAGMVGTTTVTLTALDVYGRIATDIFTVSITSNRVFVDADTPAEAGAQDGYGWSSAFRHLQDALGAAMPGQEIWVAEGVYYPDVSNAGDTDSRYDYFLIPSGVSIYGGFTGVELDRSQRAPETNRTILSGDIRQDDLQQPIANLTLPQSGTGNNSCNVVDLTRMTVADVFDGFVVTAGHGNVKDWDVGAGIWVGAGSPTISNCLVTGNEVSVDGAGIWVYKMAGPRATISNCRISGNRAAGAGGGLFLATGDLTVHNCAFVGNVASLGGGIYLDKTTSEFANCLVSGNRALADGAGLHLAKGALTVVNSSLSGNDANGVGGAMYSEVGSEGVRPAISNCIIWNNRAGGSNTSVSASIFSDESFDRPVIANSLVANSGGSASWNSSIGTDGGGNLDTDPLFTNDVTPNDAPTDSGNVALQSNSPAVDAGSMALLPADVLDLDGDGDTSEPIGIDLDGATRVSGAELDMGAFEFPDAGAIDPAMLDSDNDGLSDAFEIAHGGSAGSIDPLSDADGDGLSALAEFVHGQDPNAPLTAPVGTLSTGDNLGTDYLHVTYLVDPAALNFVDLIVQRRGDLASPEGWRTEEALQTSSVPSTSHPGLLEVTYRSAVPFGQERMEFLRMGHSPKP